MKNNFKEYKKLKMPNWTKKILLFWKNNQILKKSIHSKNKKFYSIFYEGPPSANGKPGIHHVLAITIKDIFGRYHTLKGKKVYRKAGWDTHGLPIELEVEKKLNITKEDIGKKISLTRYNNFCKNYVMRYTKIWYYLTEKIGSWVEQDKPFITYNSKYIESVWWCLKEFYKKGLLYKGYKVQPYSTTAGTGLSNHEINIPGSYKNITDTAITIQFKAKKESLPDFLYDLKGNIYLLSWTTTPWTIPSNTALTIGNLILYLIIETFNQYSRKRIKIILSKKSIYKMLDNHFFYVKNLSKLDFFKTTKKIPFFIIKEVFGKKIIGVRYYPIFEWVKPYQNYENAFKIIYGNYVKPEEGTGIVHTSPTFGLDDFISSQKYNIPLMLVMNENNKISPIVDKQGRVLKRLPYPFAVKYIKNEYYKKNKPNLSIDIEFSIFLKKNEKVFKLEKYTHSYPHCWRTAKPILYYPLHSWFIKTTSYKKRIIFLTKNINWFPKETVKNRFENWLNNLNDWNLSRSRYWGIPLPIWRTKDKKEEKIIGSLKELIHEINKSCDKGFMKQNTFKEFRIMNNYNKLDLHKHLVDMIILVSKSGKPMKRESDLIDVWFDSGSMPFAQLHYPFENKEKIDKNKFYPADFIAEGVDQTRGWFYTLHVISAMLFNSIAYKNVISNGLVLDQTGKKMSKSKGNSINSFKIIDNYSPDVVRWYMVSTSHPWETMKFEEICLEKTKKRFFGTFYNLYSFLTLYANIDNFYYQEKFIHLKIRPYIDRWILSELNQLIKLVDTSYNRYDPTCVTKTIENFVINKLSNWYLRLCRNRFWQGEYNQDKISAFQTLHDCLLTIIKLISPIAPFISEFIYKNLVNVSKKEYSESIHLSHFPKSDQNLIEEYMEKCMQLAQQITSLALSLRKNKQIKIKQPLKKLLIFNASYEKYKKLNEVNHFIKKEINVKEILFVPWRNKNYLLRKKIKPNYKIMGPKLGKKLNEIYNQLKTFSQSKIQELETNKKSSINIKENNVNIFLNEVEIYTKEIKEWSILSANGITISLDLHINKSLKYEGIARELIHIIQNLRKKKGFLVHDRIKLIIQSKNNLIKEAVFKHKKFICYHTLSLYLLQKLEINEYEKIIYDGNKIKIFIQKT